MDRTDLQEWFKQNKRKLVCPECGTVFVPETSNQKYCSSKCQIASRKTRRHINRGVAIYKDLSDNMKKIYDMVRDDPSYGKIVAKMEGKIK